MQKTVIDSLKNSLLVWFFSFQQSVFCALSLSDMGTVYCGLDFAAEAIKNGQG